MGVADQGDRIELALIAAMAPDYQCHGASDEQPE